MKSISDVLKSLTKQITTISTANLLKITENGNIVLRPTTRSSDDESHDTTITTEEA